MQSWLDERAEEIRLRRTAADEGSLWVLLFDDPHAPPTVAAAFEGAMAHMDRQMAVNLAAVVNEVSAKAILIGIPRRNGHPNPEDRELWSALPNLIDPSIELLGLIVVGDNDHWSAQQLGGSQPRHRSPPQ